MSVIANDDGQSIHENDELVQGGGGRDPFVPPLSNDYSNEDRGSMTEGTLPLNLAIKALRRFNGTGDVEEWIYAVDDLTERVKLAERDTFFLYC